MSGGGIERDVAVGNRIIHVSEFGSGPPVLLLHGGGPGASGLTNYSRNIDALARDFRVIVPDLPGYGGSTKGLDRRDPFGDLADGIRGLMDALDIASAHAVGNSLGGACAIRMALDTPERIGRMVLMGPGGIGTTRSLPTAGVRKLLGYYKGGQPDIARMRDFIAYLVHPSIPVPHALVRARYEASIDPDVLASPPLRGPANLAAARRMDFSRDRRLAKLAHPTLVLWGREDLVNRLSGGRYLARTLPNCDLHEFANTGHWVQWERPDQFNAMTANFLRDGNQE